MQENPDWWSDWSLFIRVYKKSFSFSCDEKCWSEAQLWGLSVSSFLTNNKYNNFCSTQINFRLKITTSSFSPPSSGLSPTHSDEATSWLNRYREWCIRSSLLVTHTVMSKYLIGKKIICTAVKSIQVLVECRECEKNPKLGRISKIVLHLPEAEVFSLRPATSLKNDSFMQMWLHQIYW